MPPLVPNIQTWADALEGVRLPAIENAIDDNGLQHVELSEEIIRRALELQELIDLLEIRTTGAEDDAADAKSDAADARSYLYDAAHTAMNTLAARIQTLRTEINLENADWRLQVEESIRDSVIEYISSQLSLVESKLASALSTTKSQFDSLSGTAGTITEAITELLDEHLPTFRNDIQSDLDKAIEVGQELDVFMTDLEYSSLQEGIDVAFAQAGQAGIAAAAAVDAKNLAEASADEANGYAASALSYSSVAARIMSGGVSKNPVFAFWDVLLPTNMTVVTGGTSAAEKADSSRYGNCIELTADDTTVSRPRIQLNKDTHELDCSANPLAVLVRMEVELVDGTFDSGGYVQAYWDAGTGGINASVNVLLKDHFTDTLDVVQVVEFLMIRPDTYDAGSANQNFFLDLFARDGATGTCTFRVHRLDFEEMVANTLATIYQRAVAKLDDISNSVVGMRAISGSEGAELELIALSDPNGASLSTARISADKILLDGSVSADHIDTDSFAVHGMALFGGTLQSGDFETEVSGWQIKSDGSSEFNDLKIRQDMILNGAVTADKLDAVSLSVSGMSLFGGTLKSSNYVANTSGWQIKNNGDAEFNSLVVRRGMIQDGAVSNKTTFSDPYVNLSSSGPSYSTEFIVGPVVLGQMLMIAFGGQHRRVISGGANYYPYIQVEQRSSSSGIWQTAHTFPIVEGSSYTGFGNGILMVGVHSSLRYRFRISVAGVGIPSNPSGLVNDLQVIVQELLK